MSLVMLAFALLAAMPAETAFARNYGGHASGSHGKSTGGFIHRKCKTKACFKKHPTGEYSFAAGEKRKK
jgi:hypothetical protein